MNRIVLTSGWIAAAGLLAMFVTAHTRYSSLRSQLAGPPSERTEEDRTVSQRATPAATKPAAARPAVPAPSATAPARAKTTVTVREREGLSARVSRLLEEARNSAGPEATAQQTPGAAGADAAAAGEETSTEHREEVAGAGGAEQKAAEDKQALLANLDRMIADLDRKIEANRKQPQDDVPAAARPAAGKPAQAARKKAAAGPAAGEVQVIYVHPFGSRTTGTWVKYHRFEKSAREVKFYFGDRVVMTAPSGAVEWEQRVLVN